MADSFYADPPLDTPAPAHPYYPLTAQLPNYVPNKMPVAQLIVVLGAVAAAVIGSALRQTAKVKHPLRNIDRFAAGWFALCGFLHVAFEGYYLWYRDELPGMSTPFAELWKEYTLSDSRYLTGDVFTVSIEIITCLTWGPLSWLTFILILRNSPSRHMTQIIVCIAHLYGVTLYYLTNYMEERLNGQVYSRPEFLYYWVYYAGFNFPWVVVPAVLLRDSWTEVVKGLEALGRERVVERVEKVEKAEKKDLKKKKTR